MTPAMDKTVEVSQAARDAAADHQDHKRGYACSAPLRDGRADDCSIVQAFARFEATTRATQPEAALREALDIIAAGEVDVSDTAIIVGKGARTVLAQCRAALEDHRHG